MSILGLFVIGKILTEMVEETHQAKTKKKDEKKVFLPNKFLSRSPSTGIGT